MRGRRTYEGLKAAARRMIFTGLFVVICGGMTACGGTGKRENTMTVSGAAVRVASVTGSAVTKKDVPDAGREKKKNGRFVTDTNMYLNVEGEEEAWTECFQARLDGTKHKKIFQKENAYGMMGIVGIAGNWLYYNRYRNPEQGYDVGSAICRVPVRKDKDGFDVIGESSEEVVIGEDVWDVLYMDESYIFYERRSDYQIVKYDIVKNKEVCTADFRGDNWDSDELDIFFVNDSYLAVCKEGGTFSQPADAAAWYKKRESVRAETDMCGEAMIEPLGDKLYYVPQASHKTGEPSEIMTNDGMVSACFVSESELRQAVKRAVGLPVEKELDVKPEMGVCAVTALFSGEDRLYIQVQAGWTKDDVYYMKYLIFSCSEKESELRFEQGLYDCMNAYGQNREGKWMYVVYGEEYEPPQQTLVKENAVSNDAMCIGMAGKTAYLSLFDYQKGAGRLVCYDTDSKNLYWAKEKDASFLKLCYNNAKYMDYLEVYDNEHKNRFTGFDYPQPKGEGEGIYEFDEEKKPEPSFMRE